MLLSSFQNPTSVRAAILTGLLSIRAKTKGIELTGNILKRLDAEDAFINGYPLCDFIFTDNNLTTQPFPAIRVPFHFSHPLKSLTTFYGPASDFDNITCGEFEDAEIFFYQFRDNPSHDALAHLAAILWRPKNTPYIRLVDHRKEEYNVEAVVPLFSQLPAWQLYAIYTWYVGCREQLPKLFRHAFGSEGKKSAANDYMAFTKCIHAGAGPKNGSREQIRLLPLKEFFFDIDLEALKAKEMKAELEKAKK